MNYKEQKGNQVKECPRQEIQVTRHLRMPSPQQKLPPLSPVPFPKSVPGGAKQTKSEGGVSQLLQQLREKMRVNISKTPLYPLK